MARTFVTVVLLSAASCVLTLVVASVWLATAAPASAQRPPPVIQALGFEVVDVDGNRLAYLGEAQFSPAILTLGQHNEVEITVRSRLEEHPRIQLKTADGTPVWQAP